MTINDKNESVTKKLTSFYGDECIIGRKWGVCLEETVNFKNNDSSFTNDSRKMNEDFSLTGKYSKLHEKNTDNTVKGTD